MGRAEEITRIRQRRRRPPATRADAEIPNDEDLIARVREGDADAHRVLFDRYYTRVFAFVRRRMSDEGLAEEVVCDVFYEVWRSAHAFRGASRLSSWIFGIAHLKTLSTRRFHGQLRRSSVVPTDDEQMSRFADPTDAGELLASREEVRHVLRAMEALPEGQRDVLRLAFMEGRSYRDIAEELGISENNVKVRVNRARTRLRAVSRRAPSMGDPL